jgi:hypothetical protein
MFKDDIIGPLKSYFLRKSTCKYLRSDPDPDPKLIEKSDPDP